MKYTNEELLKEAYRRFPIGTVFNSIFSDNKQKRTVSPYHPERIEMEYVVQGDVRDGVRTIYVVGGMDTSRMDDKGFNCSNPTLYKEDLGWCSVITKTEEYEIY